MSAAGAFERTVPRWPRAAVERLADRRARSIVDHAWRTVPFYREAMRERGLRPRDFGGVADLAQLPIIDGAIVQDNRDAFVSSAYPRERRKGFHTSGSSTGLRRLIFWDDRAVLLKVARAERDRAVLAELAGETWFGTISREFFGAPRARDHRRLSIVPVENAARTNRALWSQRTLIPHRASHYSVATVNEPCESVADRIEQLRPRIVFAYGSYTSQFFTYLDETGRTLPMPRVWVYMAEMVSGRARTVAERLGCSLWSVYAAIEAGAIAFQCSPQSGFHVNVDLAPVRVVDEPGADVPPGTVGDIVVSNLHNRAMVLLNYRQGDRGALSADDCPCGRTLPLISRLEGRRSDVVALPDGRRLSALSLEGLFSAALRQTRQVQIHQTSPSELKWLVVPFADAERSHLRAELLERGRAVLGAAAQMSVEFVDSIPKSDQGKTLAVVRR